MSRKRSIVVAIASIVLLAIAAAGAMSASADDGPEAPTVAAGGDALGQLLPGRQIVGTWEVTVNRGPTLPPLTSLQTFTGSHSIVEIGNETLFRSPAHGVWRYIGARTYATTQVHFRYSPTGVYLGTQKINGNRRVSPDGETYTAVAVFEARDPAGNLVGSGRATAFGRRMHVERIPDQP